MFISLLSSLEYIFSIIGKSWDKRNTDSNSKFLSTNVRDTIVLEEKMILASIILLIK